MKLGISSVLPRKAIEAFRGSIATSSTRQLTDAAASDPEVLLQGLGCSRTGLREEEAEQRLERYGPNAVASEQGHGRLGLLVKAVVNPLSEVTRFILVIGPCSSVFDYTMFLMMFFLFGARHPATAPMFQTRWFVESLLTQTLIIHVIRTYKVPFVQSRASWPLTLTSFAIMAFGVWLPFSPLASVLGFTRLPALYWPLLLVTLICYVLLTQAVKSWLIRRSWI